MTRKPTLLRSVLSFIALLEFSALQQGLPANVLATNSSASPVNIELVSSAQQFTPLTNLFATTTGPTASWGDFDNDGHFDVVLGGADARSRLLRNNADGTFTLMTDTLRQIGNRSFPGRATCADLDNDGFVDVILDAGGYGLAYFRSPDGTYQESSIGGVVGTEPAIADFDGDGRLDVLVYPYLASFHRDWSYVYFELRGTSGLEPIPQNYPPEFTSFAAYDFNSDGTSDLIVCNVGATIYTNDGSASFGKVVTLATNLTFTKAWVADFDNDGFPDLFITGISTSSVAQGLFFRNDGNGAFSQVGPILSAGPLASVSIADIDNDGYSDILLSYSTTLWTSLNPGAVRLYRNNRDWSFTDITPGFSASFGSAQWGDFDNDGDLDALIVGIAPGDAPSIVLYRNDQNSSNSPPSAPSSLASAVNGKRATLSWLAGTDSESASGNGLTYNVRVGTQPGGINIVSPASDSISGMRRLPQRGNAGSSHKLLLSKLLPGTYFWSVQTIDAGLKASSFAQENSFTIANTRPVGSNSVILMNEDTKASIRVRGSDNDGQPLWFFLESNPQHGEVLDFVTATSDTYIGSGTYKPDTNYFGQDSFTFVVFDGIDYSDPATVTVLVTNVPDVQFTRLLPSLARLDELHIVLTGEPWQQYQIETSTDLIVWSPIMLLQALPTGSVTFTNSIELSGQRFFRSRALP